MIGRTSSCPGTCSIFCIMWPIYLIHLRIVPLCSFLYHPFSPVTLLPQPTLTHTPHAHTHTHYPLLLFSVFLLLCFCSSSPFCAAAGYFLTTFLMLVLLLCLCTLLPFYYRYYVLHHPAVVGSFPSPFCSATFLHHPLFLASPYP